MKPTTPSIESCLVCNSPGSKKCSGCNSAAYCSVEHQKQHWKIHKHQCKPYKIKTNELYGRYLVASRNLPPGTIVITEPALVIGPKQDSLPICLGCHQRMKQETYLCSQCKFPLCSSSCEKMESHATNECQVFKKANVVIKIKNFEEHHPIYESILVLRCLLLKSKSPQKWARLQTMEHHNSLRQEIKDSWNRNQINIVSFLRTRCGMNEFEEMDIHTVIGYSDINLFEIRTKTTQICGLFPESALMAHNCISNTHHCVTENNQMIIRTTVEVPKGAMITLTYASTLDGTLERRKFIRESKLFDCGCDRCCDPTELNTYLSALKCPKKCSPPSSGYMLPVDPLDYKSKWRCLGCEYSLSSEAVDNIVTPIKEEIEGIKDRNKLIPSLEKIMTKYSDVVLHPNHYLMLGCIHSLSQFYGRFNGWLMDDLSVEDLRRKEMFCRSFLKILDVIEPGMSRIRGMTMYELHAAILFATNKEFHDGKINKADQKNRLLEVMELLKSSQKILEFDDVNSNTGAIAKTIPSSIEGIKSIIEHFST